jgi:hypothetical protein
MRHATAFSLSPQAAKAPRKKLLTPRARHAEHLHAQPASKGPYKNF